MSFFDDVISVDRKVDFNLQEFWKTREPTTPPHGLNVRMGEFNVNALRNAILLNVCCQDLWINPVTANNLIHFLCGDFIKLDQKIHLQVLLHYSKMDIDVLYDKCKEKKLTKEAFYSDKILSFVNRAKYEPEAQNVMVMMHPDTKNRLLDYLLTPPILSALRSGVNMLLEANISAEELQNQLHEMKIYTVMRYRPLTNLRGACLSDGIFLSTLCLAGPEFSFSYEADLVTLAAHETSHYLVRLHTQDFNYSSPFKFRDYPPKVHRVDPVYPEHSLETGRLIELMLFNGIQPDWANSSSKAARVFLNRLRTWKDFPVIKKQEHVNLDIVDRLSPSAPFGIDLEDRHLYFC